MAYQFTTTPTSSNPYIAHIVNNINLITTLNKKKKNWTRKYHKIIWGLETIANIQLQASNTYNEQIREYIYSITNDLWNILHRDMEKQVYHIQTLLADELGQCKGKGDEQVKEHIKMI